MTETSAQWDGTVLGDAATYAAPYCQDEVARYVRGLTCLVDRTTTGVIWTDEAAYNGQLECTNPAGIQIQVDTGRGIVNGWIYENDAAVTLNPVSGNGFYRVVLQRDYVNQTIRAVLIYSAIATPALTQIAGGIWEIALANFEIAGGAITAAGVVDERVYLNAEDHVEFVTSEIGWNTTGLAVVQISFSVGPPQTHGVLLTKATSTGALGRWIIPNNYIAGQPIVFEAIIASTTGPVAGNLNVFHGAYYGQCGEARNNHSDTQGFADVAFNQVIANERICFYPLSVTVATPEDILDIAFYRNGTAGGDTVADNLFHYGWKVTYFGYKR